MGFGKKLFKGKKFSFSHAMGALAGDPYNWDKAVFLTRKRHKQLRRKLGLTSNSKWVRSLKRSIGGKGVAYTQPVSASSLDGYQYSGRSVSQLMGGV